MEQTSPMFVCFVCFLKLHTAVAFAAFFSTSLLPSQHTDNPSEMTKQRGLRTTDMIMVLRAGFCSQIESDLMPVKNSRNCRIINELLAAECDCLQIFDSIALEVIISCSVLDYKLGTLTSSTTAADSFP